MKNEQRDIILFPTRGHQPSNAIFYPESATRQFSRYSAFVWGVVFMSRQQSRLPMSQMGHFKDSFEHRPPPL
jgi:hypothetical protein